jgi:Carbohydrate esterase, sialic acid-specific acetylesterase
MRIRNLLLLALGLSFTAPAAETNPAARPLELPAKNSVYLYLLMGQSNMAGRGKIEPEDKTPNPRVLVLTANGMWKLAVEPITRDNPRIMGVGPGLAFGKAMAERFSKVTIGLVPCAVGGTPLSRWQKGGDLYSNAVYHARLAMEDGTLKGILWHQGENDSISGLAETYGDRLVQMIHDIRADLGLPELPFVVGQIGEFIYKRKPNNLPEARLVNDALLKIPDRVPHTACVRSRGLTCKRDQIHFDTPAQRELGRRFAAQMIRLQASDE